MAKTRTTARRIDWQYFATNNGFYAENTSNVVPVNGSNVNGGPQGAQISFTAQTAGMALVTVKTAIISGSDFEHKPLIYLNGTTIKISNTSAQQGNGSSRVWERWITMPISFNAGTNTIAAGIAVSSGTGMSCPAGNMSISAIVFAEI